ASCLRTQAKYRGKTHGRPVGTNHLNSSVCTREYLTTAEIERLMAAARKSSRYGHRDATMILIGYRHGFLQWSQVELASGISFRTGRSGAKVGMTVRARSSDQWPSER